MAKSANSLRALKFASKISHFNADYPLISDLRAKAKRRIPGFAFNYLDGGCNDEVSLKRNSADLADVKLRPRYLGNFEGADQTTTLFGYKYDSPFGISPIGLQGMMWPGSPEALARASLQYNIPFVISTVTTSSIETLGELTEGRAWYQLYHPVKNEIRNDLLNRARAVGIDTLVITIDVPTFGYRPREYKSRLAIPPKMTVRNIIQILQHPKWAIATLRHGRPRFETILPYMSKGMNMKQLGEFMTDNFAGRITEDKLKAIRDSWQGKVIVKGVAATRDMETCLSIGVDGIIVSNHGGRQLDASQSTIEILPQLVKAYGDRMVIMVDGGLRSGVDVARCIASGAAFTFLGRAFMYGIAALGAKGADHTITILKLQLQQLMEQIGCESLKQLPDHLIQD